MTGCGRCTVGWYVKDVPVGHPDFSRLFVCDCPAGQAIRQRDLENQAGSTMMPLDQQEMTFNTFWPEKGVPLQMPDPTDKSYFAKRVRARLKILRQTSGGLVGNLKRAKAQALAFAEQPQHFLTFLGEPGCGKTHLAAAIANECLGRGLTVCFAVVPDLLDSLRATFQKDSRRNYSDVLAAHLTVDLLVLDDVGTENPTDWAGEKLYQIVNHRYNHRLPMVVTTNEIPQGLDPRMQSRLFAARNGKFEMLAGDYRLNNRC